MADKKLSSVSSVSDAAYVYAETSNGDTVKISKADLASVVAGLMGYSDTKIVYISDYNPVLDNITYNCRGYVNDGYSGNPISDSSGWAFFECKTFPDGRCMQILTGWFHPNIRYIRNYQNGTWTTWMSI